MKKTLFIFCSIITICSIIIVSCTKDNTSGETKVGYYNPPSSSTNAPGTNLNPNPNGLPYTTVTPTVTPPPPTSYGSITLSTGGTVNFTTSPSCSSSVWTGTDGGSNSISLTFSAAPTVGSYTIVPSGPTSSQVVISYNGSIAQSGNVTVAPSGSVFVATFSGAAFATFTASAGSLTCH